MSDNKGLMAGKRGLIMGVANHRSIAWGIAKACAAHGAELAFTYQGDALKKRVEPLAAEIGSKIVVPCDVTDMASIDDRYCIDIVTQISAVRAALRRVEEEVLRDHVSHCVEHAITSGNKADQREKIAELMAVIGRSDR